MEIKKYKYSAGQMFWDVALLLFIALILYVGIINHNVNYNSWLFFAFCMFMILIRLSYLSVMYFIPCFTNKIALELDEDKLQFFIKGRLLFQIPRDVAYWKDINDINYNNPPKGSAIISFTMNDGSAFGFRTKYIDGNDQGIYNTIMEYFENSKRA